MMAMKVTSLFLTYFFIISASAQTKLVFFKVYKPDGRLLQLEKEGTFAHLALQVPGGWLHAHPLRGFEKVQENL